MQVIAQTLGYELTELGEVCRDALPVEIGSMCAVFAESEVISLIAQGVPKERIIAGTLLSIAKRVAAMAGRLPLGPHVTFCGGVAQNGILAKYLQEQAQWEIKEAPEPQLVGALGAAVLAYEMVNKGDKKNES